MLFGNVFSGLSQVAKSVIGLFEKEDSQPITFFEHEKPTVVVPTVEPLAVLGDEIEKWVSLGHCERNYHSYAKKDRKIQLSNMGRVRFGAVDASTWHSEDGWFYPAISLNGRYHYACIGAANKLMSFNLEFLLLDVFVCKMPDFLESDKKAPIKVVYIDGNTENLNVDNLRWATKEEYLKKKQEVKCLRDLKRKAVLSSGEEKQETQQAIRPREEIYTAGIPDYILEDERKVEGDLIWVPIPSYEGSYEISNFGTVRSLTRTITNRVGKQQRISGRDLKRIVSNGNLAYGLSKNGQQEVFNVARLMVVVFKAHETNFNREFIVKHKDGHNGNCHINNLEVEYVK